MNQRNWLHFLFVWLIGLVSVYDTVLTVVFSDSICELERNPVGCWLLAQGGVALFVSTKAALTILVICLCLATLKTRFRNVVIPAVAAFQFALFYYLTWHVAFDGKAIMPDEMSPIVEFVRFYLGG